MKRIDLLISFLTLASVASGQGFYKGENGTMRFFSSAPLEDIEAESRKVTSALNAATGEVAVLISINSFVFDKSLMQEHFNENYLESDKYPAASFTGKIPGHLSLNTGETRSVKVSGNLTIHNVTMARDIQVTLEMNSDGSLSASGNFKVNLEDHKVKIPQLLFQNIAEEVEVSFELKLKRS